MNNETELQIQRQAAAAATRSEGATRLGQLQLTAVRNAGVKIKAGTALTTSDLKLPGSDRYIVPEASEMSADDNALWLETDHVAAAAEALDTFVEVAKSFGKDSAEYKTAYETYVAKQTAAFSEFQLQVDKAENQIKLSEQEIKRLDGEKSSIVVAFGGLKRLFGYNAACDTAIEAEKELIKAKQQRVEELKVLSKMSEDGFDAVMRTIATGEFSDAKVLQNKTGEILSEKAGLSKALLKEQIQRLDKVGEKFDDAAYYANLAYTVVKTTRNVCFVVAAATAAGIIGSTALVGSLLAGAGTLATMGVSALCGLAGGFLVYGVVGRIANGCHAIASMAIEGRSFAQARALYCENQKEDNHAMWLNAVPAGAVTFLGKTTFLAKALSGLPGRVINKVLGRAAPAVTETLTQGMAKGFTAAEAKMQGLLTGATFGSVSSATHNSYEIFFNTAKVNVQTQDENGQTVVTTRNMSVNRPELTNASFLEKLAIIGKEALIDGVVGGISAKLGMTAVARGEASSLGSAGRVLHSTIGGTKVIVANAAGTFIKSMNYDILLTPEYITQSLASGLAGYSLGGQMMHDINASRSAPTIAPTGGIRFAEATAAVAIAQRAAATKTSPAGEIIPGRFRFTTSAEQSQTPQPTSTNASKETSLHAHPLEHAHTQTLIDDLATSGVRIVADTAPSLKMINSTMPNKSGEVVTIKEYNADIRDPLFHALEAHGFDTTDPAALTDSLNRSGLLRNSLPADLIPPGTTKPSRDNLTDAVLRSLDTNAFQKMAESNNCNVDKILEIANTIQQNPRTYDLPIRFMVEERVTGQSKRVEKNGDHLNIVVDGDSVTFRTIADIHAQTYYETQIVQPAKRIADEMGIPWEGLGTFIRRAESTEPTILARIEQDPEFAHLNRAVKTAQELGLGANDKISTPQTKQKSPAAPEISFSDDNKGWSELKRFIINEYQINLHRSAYRTDPETLETFSKSDYAHRSTEKSDMIGRRLSAKRDKGKEVPSEIDRLRQENREFEEKRLWYKSRDEMSVSERKALDDLYYPRLRKPVEEGPTVTANSTTVEKASDFIKQLDEFKLLTKADTTKEAMTRLGKLTVGEKTKSDRSIKERLDLASLNRKEKGDGLRDSEKEYRIQLTRKNAPEVDITASPQKQREQLDARIEFDAKQLEIEHAKALAEGTPLTDLIVTENYKDAARNLVTLENQITVTRARLYQNAPDVAELVRLTPEEQGDYASLKQLQREIDEINLSKDESKTLKEYSERERKFADAEGLAPLSPAAQKEYDYLKQLQEKADTSRLSSEDEAKLEQYRTRDNQSTAAKTLKPLNQQEQNEYATLKELKEKADASRLSSEEQAKLNQHKQREEKLAELAAIKPLSAQENEEYFSLRQREENFNTSRLSPEEEARLEQYNEREERFADVAGVKPLTAKEQSDYETLKQDLIDAKKSGTRLSKKDFARFQKYERRDERFAEVKDIEPLNTEEQKDLSALTQRKEVADKSLLSVGEQSKLREYTERQAKLAEIASIEPLTPNEQSEYAALSQKQKEVRQANLSREEQGRLDEYIARESELANAKAITPLTSEERAEYSLLNQRLQEATKDALSRQEFERLRGYRTREKILSKIEGIKPLTAEEKSEYIALREKRRAAKESIVPIPPEDKARLNDYNARSEAITEAIKFGQNTRRFEDNTEYKRDKRAFTFAEWDAERALRSRSEEELRARANTAQHTDSAFSNILGRLTPWRNNLSWRRWVYGYRNPEDASRQQFWFRKAVDKVQEWNNRNGRWPSFLADGASRVAPWAFTGATTYFVYETKYAGINGWKDLNLLENDYSMLSYIHSASAYQRFKDVMTAFELSFQDEALDKLTGKYNFNLLAHVDPHAERRQKDFEEYRKGPSVVIYPKGVKAGDHYYKSLDQLTKEGYLVMTTEEFVELSNKIENHPATKLFEEAQEAQTVLSGLRTLDQGFSSNQKLAWHDMKIIEKDKDELEKKISRGESPTIDDYLVVIPSKNNREPALVKSHKELQEMTSHNADYQISQFADLQRTLIPALQALPKDSTLREQYYDGFDWGSAELTVGGAGVVMRVPKDTLSNVLSYILPVYGQDKVYSLLDLSSLAAQVRRENNS